MNKPILFTIAFLTLLSGCCQAPQTDKGVEAFKTISKEVKSQYAPDRRDKVYDIRIENLEGQYILYGSTTEKEVPASLVQKLNDQGFSAKDSIVVLPDPALGDKIYAICALSVGNLRYAPDYSSELATQILMGTPLKVLEKESYWYHVITPEGYVAWITAGSLKLMNLEEFNQWKESDRIILTAHYSVFRDRANFDSQIVSDGVWGDIVQKDGKQYDSFYGIRLPNGKRAFVPKTDAIALDKWLEQRNPVSDRIIFTAKRFLGFPYLWAGTSIKGMDCSGFVKTVFFLNGVILRRDASQIVKTGVDVDITNGLDNLREGDLIFFGRKATEKSPERVTHIGIYLKDGEFLHSATFVKINSLLPEADNYYDGSTRLVRAKRVIGQQDLESGITSIAKHPWYFNK